jgi:hypothetical protein
VADFLIHFAPARAQPGAAAALVAACADDGALRALFAALEREAAAAAAAAASGVDAGAGAAARARARAAGWLTNGACARALSSAHFDARAALYAAGGAVDVPYPQARPLDCVAKAAALLPAGAGAGAGAPLPRLGVLHGARAAERDRAWRAGEVGAPALRQLAAAAAGVGAPAAAAARWAADRRAVRVLLRAHDGLVTVTGSLAAVDALGNVLLLGARRDGGARGCPDDDGGGGGGGGGGVGGGGGGGGGGDSVVGFLTGGDGARARQLLLSGDAVVSIALA